MDIGHTQRIGVDPTQAGEKYFSRLFDIHLKDVDKAAEDGKTVEIGRGVIDIPKFLNMLVNKLSSFQLETYCFFHGRALFYYYCKGFFFSFMVSQRR